MKSIQSARAEILSFWSYVKQEMYVITTGILTR